MNVEILYGLFTCVARFERTLITIPSKLSQKRLHSRSPSPERQPKISRAHAPVSDSRMRSEIGSRGTVQIKLILHFNNNLLKLSLHFHLGSATKVVSPSVKSRLGSSYSRSLSRSISPAAHRTITPEKFKDRLGRSHMDHMNARSSVNSTSLSVKDRLAPPVSFNFNYSVMKVYLGLLTIQVNFRERLWKTDLSKMTGQIALPSNQEQF